MVDEVWVLVAIDVTVVVVVDVGVVVGVVVIDELQDAKIREATMRKVSAAQISPFFI